MEITKDVIAGKKDKGDIEITLSSLTKRGTEIILESSVEKLFGNHLRAFIKAFLSEMDVAQCGVKALDDGALDFVIKSRLEAALYKQDKTVLERFSTGKRKKKNGKIKLRRTRSYVPGNNPHLIENAGLFGADVVILDLEDGVSQNEKIDARFLVRNTLSTVDFGESEVIVRLNPFTNRGEDDLKTVLPSLPDAIMLPKTNRAEDIKRLENLLDEEEEKNSIPLGRTKIFPLIESAEGVINAYTIARSSERNVMLVFGAEDFTADIGVEKSKEGRELFFARTQIVLAAKAAGIQASDTVYSDFGDVEGLIKDTQLSKSLGFDGRGVIHPLQIEHIHNVYKPTSEEVDYAKRVVAAFEDAKTKGKGVASLGRKMIDAPVVKRARRVLALTKRYDRLK